MLGISAFPGNGMRRGGTASPAMKAAPPEHRTFEFRFPALDTLVKVEVRDERVTIRASRDSFSSQRKEAFIHELAAEGFIPDEYRWHSVRATGWATSNLRWLVDYSWRAEGPESQARAQKFALRTLAGSVVLLGVLTGMILVGSPGTNSVSSVPSGILTGSQMGRR
jgi:hypothetical protein